MKKGSPKSAERETLGSTDNSISIVLRKNEMRADSEGNLLEYHLSRMRPEAIILTGFMGAILAGTLLLWLPFSQKGTVHFSDALFTAASAVCVTGLTVIDVGSECTIYGQIILLILIQLGGLGVMTFASLAYDLLGKRLSLGGQEAMTSSLVHHEMVQGFRTNFKYIVRLVFGVEVAGSLLLSSCFIPERGFFKGLFCSIFHSISAFCNAGFSLYPDSLIRFRSNWLVIGTISMLIVTGGIGFPVLFDLWEVVVQRKGNGRNLWKRFSIHTRITVRMTAILLVAGFVFLMILGDQGQKIDPATAIFHSISARTAGFNTIPMDGLPLASLLVLIVLMFIGGSPGSCAGGVKTTTTALWLSQLWARLIGRSDVVVQERTISRQIVKRASLIISLAMLWNLLGLFFLSITENVFSHPFLHDILFEQISAFGTVGLSTGLTPRLSEAGRLWIIATMFIGRIGPLTAVFLILRKDPHILRYPEGKVMIG